MLDISSQTLLFIIDKAKELQTEDSIAVPDEPLVSVDDWDARAASGEVSNPIYVEAANAIDELSPDEQVSLVALMWLGRGDFELSQWRLAEETARAQHNERTADYLLSTPLFASYLEEGLAQLSYEEDEDAIEEG